MFYTGTFRLVEINLSLSRNVFIAEKHTSSEIYAFMNSTNDMTYFHRRFSEVKEKMMMDFEPYTQWQISPEIGLDVRVCRNTCNNTRILTLIPPVCYHLCIPHAFKYLLSCL